MLIFFCKKTIVWNYNDSIYSRNNRPVTNAYKHVYPYFESYFLLGAMKLSVVPHVVGKFSRKIFFQVFFFARTAALENAQILCMQANLSAGYFNVLSKILRFLISERWNVTTQIYLTLLCIYVWILGQTCATYGNTVGYSIIK